MHVQLFLGRVVSHQKTASKGVFPLQFQLQFYPKDSVQHYGAKDFLKLF